MFLHTPLILNNVMEEVIQLRTIYTEPNTQAGLLSMTKLTPQAVISLPDNQEQWLASADIQDCMQLHSVPNVTPAHFPL